jgi:thiamine-phosphate pyrophosphorylase
MLCLVTNRQRFGGPAGPPAAEARRRLVDQVKEAVDAGVGLIQVRERDLDGGALADLAGEVVRIANGSETRVVVNERVDVALACGANGVHLRGNSLSAADARRITPPGFLIGRSVHAPHEAAGAGPVDYLFAGTVFSSASKASQGLPLGLEGLRAIVSAAGSTPVLAIGGITPENAPRVAETGVAGVAAIGLFASGSALRSIVASMAGLFDSARAAF